jgi:hypothetical protein
MTDRVPIVQQLPSGREIVVGQGYDMESAERIAFHLAAAFPQKTYYVDCSRTIEEIQAGAA